MISIFDPNDVCDESKAVLDLPCKITHQLLQCSSVDLVSNVNTTFSAFRLDNKSYPITINHTEYSNAIVCSPYTTYVTYPLDEIKKISKQWIKLLVFLNVSLMFFLCRITKFNKVIQVNNNLNSLLHYPKHFKNCLKEKTNRLIEKFPDHAIVFARVNEKLDHELLETLKENNYIVFPDRTSHIFFPDRFSKRSHFKRDLSLLRKTSHEIVSHAQLTLKDANRFATLYRLLFVDKHTKKNPHYTEYYFSNAIEHQWHHYVALKDNNGQIDAFISWYVRDNVMFCGPLGYDPNIDTKAGLYRMLVAICLKYAAENNFIFNMGGGSVEFKRNRGSVEVLEYTAVYCKHLPFYRKIPWKIYEHSFRVMIRKIISESKF